jgi:glyoxylase-like metal-dependent hydrolase (beta-lactamase superfamily II)
MAHIGASSKRVMLVLKASFFALKSGPGVVHNGPCVGLNIAGDMKLEIGEYQIDVLLQGYPGKAVCHGALGWSTVSLVRGGGRVVIVDTGPFGARAPIIKQLGERGLAPSDVTDVLLSHAHYDHSINWTMFDKARIVIGESELEWSLGEPWGTTPVPELYMRELKRWPRLKTVRDCEEVFPGMSARMAPGHTPGHMVYVLETRDLDVVFTGDAVKNRAELLSGRAFHTYDQAVSGASIAFIRQLWERRPGSILVPGHDLPMALQAGEAAYLGDRRAAIEAWFGDTLDQITSYSICLPAGG